MLNLIEKYNVPVPRYTSYPSVPHWHTMPATEQWESIVSEKSKDETTGISLYIHLPYCESLCTYCGCNTRITVNHAVEEPYIHGILAEWAMYKKVFAKKPRIKEIHLGGGTPTFFSPAHLAMLISGILSHSEIAKDAVFSIEAHPGVTTKAHLETLAELGFKRISFGVQDFNPHILEAINRRQTADQVEQITRDARALGFDSVNYDFVYGLPFQTKQDIIKNAEYVKQLRPDRIAFYSYAHVPWKKGGQRKFSEKDLPETLVKIDLYETGRKLFMEAGYNEIGMDHFALPDDQLFTAEKEKTLYRDFMGYVPEKPSMLIALGCSAISDTGNCYVQNNPIVEDYLKAINSGKWAFVKGHLLNEEELRVKRHILNLMCFFETSWDESENAFFHELEEDLKVPQQEGVLKLSPGKLKLTTLGRHFVRNICAIIDPYINKQLERKNTFSKAI